MMFYEAEATGDGGLLQRLLGITYEILHAQEIAPALESICARGRRACSDLSTSRSSPPTHPGGELYRRVLAGLSR